MLEDGTVFEGSNFGCQGEVMGEVVFNTSMTGYQEILTDPSYYEQIVTMTYPLIGNYGINSKDIESDRVRVKGFIVREYQKNYSNWRSEKSLEEYLKEHNIIGISEIDTRKLTKHIRAEGAMKGVIASGDFDRGAVLERLKSYPDMVGRNLVDFVSCKEPYTFNPDKKDCGYRVTVYDYGVKFNILRCLSDAGFKVDIVPAATDPKAILAANPDGVLLSNGPGDPAAVDYAISNIKKLVGKKPIFGICLGHQLLSLALGARTYKLKFGHHGANHPVKNLDSGEVEVTTQNHGFSVDIDSLKNIKLTDFRITHLNLNDKTIEGIEYPKVHSCTVQHHPEAGPGPHDSRYIFKKFADIIENFNKM